MESDLDPMREKIEGDKLANDLYRDYRIKHYGRKLCQTTRETCMMSFHFGPRNSVN